MTIRELIQDLEQMAERLPSGHEAEVMLFDTDSGNEFRVVPDEDRFDFQVTRGDDEVTLEF